MAELDLISADAFHEHEVGPLVIRVTPVTPPEHPLGPEYADPHWGIFARGLEGGLWIGLNVTPSPDAALETLSEDDLERAERLSILTGVSWRAVAHSARGVTAAQEEAVMRLPPGIYSASPEELRRVRSKIPANDPEVVAQLLTMTYYWQTDEGGYRAARFG